VLAKPAYHVTARNVNSFFSHAGAPPLIFCGKLLVCQGINQGHAFTAAPLTASARFGKKVIASREIFFFFTLLRFKKYSLLFMSQTVK